MNPQNFPSKLGKKNIKKLSQQELLAAWVFDQSEWDQIAEEVKTEPKPGVAHFIKGAMPFLVLIIGQAFGRAIIAPAGEIPIEKIAVSSFVLFAVFAFLSGLYLKWVDSAFFPRVRRGDSPTVFISKNGIAVGDKCIFWDRLGSQLLEVKPRGLIAGHSVLELRIKQGMVTPHILLPVPKSKAGDVERIIGLLTPWKTARAA